MLLIYVSFPPSVLSICILSCLSPIGSLDQVTYAHRKRVKAGDGSVVSHRQPSEGLGEGSCAGRAQRAASKAPIVEQSGSSSNGDEESNPDAEVESESGDDEEESPPISVVTVCSLSGPRRMCGISGG